MVLAIFALWRSRQRFAPQDALRPIVRTASLNASMEEGKSIWWLGLLSTLLPLAGTVSLLTIRWQTIPERFPIHWGIDGRPNGWAHRSPASAFGLLILAAILILAIALLGEITSRSSPGHEGRAAMVRTTRTILLACSWFVTILLCSISLLPLAHNPTNLVPFIVIGCSVFSLGILGYIAYRSARLPQIIAAGQNSTDARFWKAGLIYYNPADSALMVPKREGFGYTMNFGRPISWLILGAILLIPLVLPILLRISSKR